jgi:hypothetical protein
MRLRNSVRTIVLALSIALAGAATLPGCAFIKANPRHASATAALSVHDALAAVQDQEMAIYTAKAPFVITAAEHQRFNRALVDALKAGQAFDHAIEAWPAGQTAPPNLPTLVQDVGKSATALLDAVPNPQLRATLAVSIASAESIALNVIAVAAAAK